MENRATSSSLMQKLTITAAGTHLIDVTPGRTVYFAVSGTYTATITVEYATAPGVFAPYSTTPVTLSAPGEKTAINVGAHSELRVNVSSYTSGTAIIIANAAALQERGR